jgi:hypothetical protein
MRKSILALACAAAALSACSPRPDTIFAAPTGIHYAHLQCSEIATELLREKVTLANLEADQQRVATADFVGVATSLVPTGRVLGQNKADKVAEWKGRVMELEMRQAECGPRKTGHLAYYR